MFLTYAKATLLDGSLTERIVPLAAERDVGVINAAAVSLGILTPNGTNMLEGHPATSAILHSAMQIRNLAAERGVEVAFVANQYSIWRSGARPTTVVGAGRVQSLEFAVAAAQQPRTRNLKRPFSFCGRRRTPTGG